MEKRYKYKLCLLGDGAVGKTSLLRKFVYDEFDDAYLATIGAKTVKKVMVVSHPRSTLPIEVVFMISDVMGQTDVRSIHDAYFYGTSGALIICDVTRQETLLNLENWVAKLNKVVGDVPMIFLGNKSDLDYKAMFGLKELQETVSEYGQPAFLTSARTGDNVEDSFRKLAQIILLNKT